MSLGGLIVGLVLCGVLYALVWLVADVLTYDPRDEDPR